MKRTKLKGEQRAQETAMRGLWEPSFKQRWRSADYSTKTAAAANAKKCQVIRTKFGSQAATRAALLDLPASSRNYPVYSTHD